MIADSCRETSSRVSSRFIDRVAGREFVGQLPPQAGHFVGCQLAADNGHLHHAQHVDEVLVADEFFRGLAELLQHGERVLAAGMRDQQGQAP